jgi:Reverse transcriptase (RNA-dependent DNA polymerase)
VFWGEAVHTSVYLINRLPSPVTGNISPYEQLCGNPPVYSHLKVFGSSCFVLLPKREHDKLSQKSVICVFLGYGTQKKGYRCYDTYAKKLRISRHVTFWERIPFFSLPPHKPPATENETLIDSFYTEPATLNNPSERPDHSSELSENLTPNSDPITTVNSRPVWERRAPSHLQDYHCFLSAILPLHEPKSYQEASSDPRWREAMAEELAALEKMKTWNLVNLPPGKAVVGCKWVYKIKTKSNGSIERYKARLVAKGFTQEYGVDYEETFAHVAHMPTVRTLLAVAVNRKWRLHQLDVKNAFLNGDLAEKVYMSPPPGMNHEPNHVCRLNRALYGLKQAPWAWFDKFRCTITSFGFHQSHHDKAMFIRSTSQGMTLLLLYVDDMILTGNDEQGIKEIKQQLQSCLRWRISGNSGIFWALK